MKQDTEAAIQFSAREPEARSGEDLGTSGFQAGSSIDLTQASSMPESLAATFRQRRSHLEDDAELRGGATVRAKPLNHALHEDSVLSASPPEISRWAADVNDKFTAREAPPSARSQLRRPATLTPASLPAPRVSGHVSQRGPSTRIQQRRDEQRTGRRASLQKRDKREQSNTPCSASSTTEESDREETSTQADLSDATSRRHTARLIQLKAAMPRNRSRVDGRRPCTEKEITESRRAVGRNANQVSIAATTDPTVAMEEGRSCQVGQVGYDPTASDLGTLYVSQTRTFSSGAHATEAAAAEKDVQSRRQTAAVAQGTSNGEGLLRNPDGEDFFLPVLRRLSQSFSRSDPGSHVVI